MPVTITGLVESRRALDQQPRDFVRRSITPALAAAISVIRDEVAARTPVRTEHRSGEFSGVHLKDALVTGDVQVDEDGLGASVAIGFGELDEVAGFVEFGHRIAGHDGKQVAARPFMRQALEASAPAAIEAFAENLEDHNGR